MEVVIALAVMLFSLILVLVRRPVLTLVSPSSPTSSLPIALPASLSLAVKPLSTLTAITTPTLYTTTVLPSPSPPSPSSPSALNQLPTIVATTSLLSSEREQMYPTLDKSKLAISQKPVEGNGMQSAHHLGGTLPQGVGITENKSTPSCASPQSHTGFSMATTSPKCM